MNKIHETQSTEEFYDVEKDNLYTPIEDLQRIEAGGIYKRNNVNLKSLPKGIRLIGYFILGFTVVTGILVFILNLLF